MASQDVTYIEARKSAGCSEYPSGLNLATPHWRDFTFFRALATEGFHEPTIAASSLSPAHVQSRMLRGWNGGHERG